MSFFELPGLADVKEKKAAPEGAYDLCIVSATVKENEGKTNIQCILEIEGQPEYSNVFHYLSLPSSNDDQAKKETKMLFLKRFLTQFGINADNGLETEQMVGSRCTAGHLTLEEYTPTNEAGEATGKMRVSNRFDPNPLPAEG